MRWFRRKRSGRHALGAAVTSIPSEPLRVPVAPPAAAPEPAIPAVPVPATSSARSSLDAALAQLLPLQSAEPVPPVAEPVAAPRVQLGFRDGTSTTLEPGSDQALALELLAQSLTRRD